MDPWRILWALVLGALGARTLLRPRAVAEYNFKHVRHPGVRSPEDLIPTARLTGAIALVVAVLVALGLF